MASKLTQAEKNGATIRKSLREAYKLGVRAALRVLERQRDKSEFAIELLTIAEAIQQVRALLAPKRKMEGCHGFEKTGPRRIRFEKPKRKPRRQATLRSALTEQAIQDAEKARKRGSRK